MKSTNRAFVSVRKDRRRSREFFTVTWTPEPGDRRRRIFSGPDAESNANSEADAIESALQRGHAGLSKIPRTRLAIINTLCESLPDDGGCTLLNLLQNHIKQTINGHNGHCNAPTIEQAGREYISSRSSQDFSERQRQSVRQHVLHLIKSFGPRPVSNLTTSELQNYFDEIVGGAAKTRKNHLITIRAFYRWIRDVKKYLPHGMSTAADVVQTPKVVRAEHEVYSPEEFTRLLVFTPADLVQFFTLGQFAGIRAAERLRLTWKDWRSNEDGKLVLNAEVTKTSRRRRVDVLPNLAEWLTMFSGEPDKHIVPCRKPHTITSNVFRLAAVPSKNNALRAGYASYHLELFENAALTAKNDGHSVSELESVYRSISGVTKKTAQEMFNITPQVVTDYARAHDLPEPEWSKILQKNNLT